MANDNTEYNARLVAHIDKMHTLINQLEKRIGILERSGEKLKLELKKSNNDMERINSLVHKLRRKTSNLQLDAAANTRKPK